MEFDMKKLVYYLGLLTLLASTGCVIRADHHERGGAYDHGYWEHGHDDRWDRD